MGEPEDKGGGKPAEKPKGKGRAKPPKLPDDAPQDVKDFVDCKSDSITLDPTKKGFLPEIPVIGAPNVKFEKGAKAGTAKVSLTKAGGLLDASFTVGVKDGHLDADTTGVKPEFVKDGIDNWVKKYNDWLDAKKRKLQDITVKDGKATITKAPVAAGQSAVPSDGPGWGKKVLVGTVATVALAGGGYVAYQAISDDDGSTPTEVAAEPAAGGGATVTCGDIASDGANDVVDLSSLARAVSGDCAFPTGADAFDCAPPLSCGPYVDALFQGIGVEINHTDEPPVDVITGQQGASGATVVGATTWPDVIQIAADCGGQTVTGQGQADDTGVFRVPIPVYQFGPCEIVQFKLREGTQFSDGLPVSALDVTTFDVTQDELFLSEDEIRTIADRLLAYNDAIASDALLVAGAFDPGGLCYLNTVVSDAAVRQAFADALCQPSSPGDHYGLQVVDQPSGGNPDLVGGTTFDGFDQASLDLLFGDNGVFRCGAGNLGYTVCPDPAADFPPGPISVYQGVLPDDFADDLTFEIPGAGDVTVTPGGADSTVSAPDDLPYRVVVRDGAVTLAVPGVDTDTVTVGGVEVTLDPTVALSGDSGEPTPPGEEETVQGFATQLAQSLAGDDHSFAQDRLDPAVLQAFPEACPAHFDALPADPSYAITVVDVSQPEPYDYVPPSLGTSITDDGVVVVTADVTSDGETDRAELHFGHAGSGYTWFTDCGRGP
jgi:hypothetical protein